MRVHELAKELGVTSKELLATLEQMGVAGKSASSSVPEDLVPRLRASGGKATEAPKRREVLEPPPAPRKPKPKPKPAAKEAAAPAGDRPPSLAVEPAVRPPAAPDGGAVAAAGPSGPDAVGGDRAAALHWSEASAAGWHGPRPSPRCRPCGSSTARRRRTSRRRSVAGLPTS